MVKVQQEHFNQLCKSQRSSEHVNYTYVWDFIYNVERVSWFWKDNGFEQESEGNIKCNQFNVQITERIKEIEHQEKKYLNLEILYGSSTI